MELWVFETVEEVRDKQRELHTDMLIFRPRDVWSCASSNGPYVVVSALRYDTLTLTETGPTTLHIMANDDNGPLVQVLINATVFEAYCGQTHISGDQSRTRMVERPDIYLDPFSVSDPRSGFDSKE